METSLQSNEQHMPMNIQPDFELNYRFHSEAYDVHSARLGKMHEILAKNPKDSLAAQLAMESASKMTFHLHCLFNMAVDDCAHA